MSNRVADRVVIDPSGAIRLPTPPPPPVELWEALRAEYLALGRSPISTDDRVIVPSLLHRDLIPFLAAWHEPIAQAGAMWAVPRWVSVVGEVVTAARGADPDTVYPGTAALWRRTRDLARELEATPVERWSESPAITPGKIARAAVAGAFGLGPTIVSEAAGVVGASADHVASSVWRTVRWPLAIGALLLGAVLLVPRLIPQRREV